MKHKEEEKVCQNQNVVLTPCTAVDTVGRIHTSDLRSAQVSHTCDLSYPDSTFHIVQKSLSLNHVQ